MAMMPNLMDIETNMKKILLAVTLVLVYNNSMACTTTTIVSGGKYVVCTVCPNSTVCI